MKATDNIGYISLGTCRAGAGAGEAQICHDSVTADLYLHEKGERQAFCCNLEQRRPGQMQLSSPQNPRSEYILG